MSRTTKSCPKFWRSRCPGSVTSTAVTAYRVDNKSVDGHVAEAELDEMLKNPVPVSITLVFNAPGTYEIRLYLRKAGSISSSPASVRITVK